MLISFNYFEFLLEIQKMVVSLHHQIKQKTLKMSKVKCYSVRLESLTRISEKAFKATAFDGSSDIIPASQVFGQDYEVEKSLAFWISAWILEQKNIQYSTKKVSHFDKELATYIPETGTEVERLVPERIEPVETKPLDELLKPTINITPDELLPMMRKLSQNNQLRPLTVKAAKELKGKRIRTIYFGYRGQDGVDDFIVGDIVTNYDRASQRPDATYGTQAKYWDSYMTGEQIDNEKTTLAILDNTGNKSYFQAHTKYYNFYGDEHTFTCSDADRTVYYIEVSDATA